MPAFFKQLFVLFVILLTGELHAMPQTFQHKLDNGMTILVRPIHKAPVVVSMVWYRVGGSDEHLGITGVSHVLEHMMFKGTKTLKPGEFSEIIAKNGGQENAFTNRDSTAYFQTIKNDKLGLCLKLEADRMNNLQIKAEEFKKELQVVKEERRMRTDDNPQALTRERLFATMHQATPYHNPVIGWPSDLDNLTSHDAKDWYQRWYTPSNAVLVVVGDVNEQAVFKLAAETFGKIKARPLAKSKPSRSLTALGEQHLSVHTRAALPMLVLGFQVPSLNTIKDKKEAYALDLLSGILSAGNSTRLNKELVRQQKIASTAESYYDLYARLDSEFLIYAIPSKQKDLALLTEKIQQEIERLKTTEVSQAELARVKNQIVAAKVFERDSLFGQAMMLGLLETTGIGWQEGEHYPKKIEEVDAKMLQAVAKKYLTKKRLTIATLLPLSKD
jgi:zinc protease